MKVNWKVIGALAAVGGAVLSLVANTAESRRQDTLIKDEVGKAVQKALTEKEGL